MLGYARGTEDAALHRLDIPLGQRHAPKQRQQGFDALARSHAGIEPATPSKWPVRDPHLVAGLKSDPLGQLNQTSLRASPGNLHKALSGVSA
jgi:hypothetical protein